MVAAHGAYLNGCRKASPAWAPATRNTAASASLAIRHDDLGAACVAIPLERHSVARVFACV